VEGLRRLHCSDRGALIFRSCCGQRTSRELCRGPALAWTSIQCVWRCLCRTGSRGKKKHETQQQGQHHDASGTSGLEEAG